MNFIRSQCPRDGKADLSFLTRAAAEETLAFHSGFPQYAPTPLVRLKNLADFLGVKEIFVKNESKRFSLNAFKVLGGSYAIGTAIAEKLGIAPEDMTYELLVSPETRAKTGDLTFVTATDGNHGRGVAWTARTLGYDAYVYMPKGTAKERLDNILATGAHAYITDMIYDDTVRYAKKQAAENGRILIQDTAWEGYTDVPAKIMQGYTTLALECERQLGDTVPTHIFAQAGVGSMAAAVLGYFRLCYRDAHPFLTVCEPDNAACIFNTAKANDGRLHFVTEMDTIQAGLACGEPCTTAWDILRECADGFATIPDSAAATGMRVLACPLAGDEPVTAGESGAAGFGTVFEILSKRENADIRSAMGLDENSVVLVINTEGATDRENYRRVVWGGAYPGV